MGVMIGIGVLIAGVVGSSFSQLLTDELKAWTPRLAEHLIGLAVRRLPEEHRVRYEEEWRAHIVETPGHIAKILVAAGFVLASRRIVAVSPPTKQAMVPAKKADKKEFEIISLTVLGAITVSFAADFLSARVANAIWMRLARWILRSQDGER